VNNRSSFPLPGIGRHVAAKFATQGFPKVFLLSRNTERLKEDITFVKARAVEAGADTSVKGVPVDLADPGSLRAALGELDKRLDGRSVEAVLFNAARVGQSKLAEWSAVNYETDFRVCMLVFLLLMGALLTSGADIRREYDDGGAMGDADALLGWEEGLLRPGFPGDEWWFVQGSLPCICE
jgi:NAD(P)-dependent dehydrogenase (short-subunit alcohol dehydrogenase family)